MPVPTTILAFLRQSTANPYMECYADAARRAAASSLPHVLCAVLLVVLLQQLSYLRKKGPLPGPTFVVPFLGNVLSMIRNPARFWVEQAALARDSGLGVSANFLAGRFVVFVRSTELSHRIFANVHSDAFQLIGHPFGKKLFGDHNLIYLFDQEHKDLRRRIAPNFTPRALSAYVDIQQSVIRSHLRKWLDLAAELRRPVPLWLLCRDLNLETSQTVFAGTYLNDASRRQFASDYGLFNVGVMAIPIDLPGFAFRRARLAVSRLVRTLSDCVALSKERMRRGDEPACLIDFWMQETLREIDEAEAKGDHPPPESGDLEVGSHLFDFLFAAQDASTSSLLWTVSLLDAHPEVLAKVREEVATVWRSPERPITPEQLRQMRYTEAVAREVVRFRPPATLVPHVTREPFALTEWYTVPKGAIVFPSVYESSFQGFTSPERFDPERFFSDTPAEGRDVQKRHYLVFGAGPHQCVGQRYAINHLVLFISLFISLVDFRRHCTPGCDEIAYVPTIIPKDECLVHLTERTSSPSLSATSREH